MVASAPPQGPRPIGTALATAVAAFSYPSYFLTGSDGRIIMRNAPRPSDGDKLIVALEQALARAESPAAGSK
jgi:hypothetical protein